MDFWQVLFFLLGAAGIGAYLVAVIKNGRVQADHELMTTLFNENRYLKDKCDYLQKKLTAGQAGGVPVAEILNNHARVLEHLTKRLDELPKSGIDTEALEKLGAAHASLYERLEQLSYHVNQLSNANQPQTPTITG